MRYKMAALLVGFLFLMGCTVDNSSTIQMSVTDSNARPVADAFISGTDITGNQLFAMETDNEGKASVAVPGGTYQVSVEKENYETHSQRVYVSILETLQINPVLKPIRTNVGDNCQPVGGQNDALDSKRFNLVFLPVGFSSPQAAQGAIEQIMDFDDSTKTMVGFGGFLQAIPIKNYQNRFNTWMITPISLEEEFRQADEGEWGVSKQNFNDCNQLEEITGIQTYHFLLYERNSVFPGTIIPGQHERAQYGSYGRTGAVIDWPEEWDTPYYQENNQVKRRDILATNIHEMSHSIFQLWDEYPYRSANPKDDRDSFFDTQEQPILWRNQLQYYFQPYGQPLATVEECMNQAPWKNDLGNGCGEPGVIDCFSDPLQPSFSNCTTADQSCWYEVVCVEGSPWKSGSFTAQLNGLMKNTHNLEAVRYGGWTEKLVEYALQKGATNDQHFDELYRDFPT